MVRMKRSLAIIAASAILGGGGMASAQDSEGNVAGNVIGPPQLRDFSLQPQNRIVTQPAPPPAPAPEAQPQQSPVRVAPPPPAATTPPRAAPSGETQRPQSAPAQPPAAAPAPQTAPPVADIPTESPPLAQPLPETGAPEPEADGAAPDAVEAQPIVEEGGAVSYWPYALAVLLVLAGAILLRRRSRRSDADAEIASPAVAAAPTSSKTRPEPGMRPWLELELKTERAAYTDAEASVSFELEIRNSGKSVAKNLRIDVKMFNGSEQQDQEIGTFFRTAGRETTRLNLPEIAAGQSGVIRGEVGIPREQMRALRLDDRMLFIPVIAVNALYDCDDGRTGQTSRSYIVGRELQAESERMGAFRVDQGPRIWRTVGQRPHKLARRV